jgi:tetratricopeptide (TPR) repeat protein
MLTLLLTHAVEDSEKVNIKISLKGDELLTPAVSTVPVRRTHRVDMALEGGEAPLTATALFDFQLASQDLEDLRWYLEDFLLYPQNPARRIAERVEQRMDDLGKEFFRALFQSGNEERNLWQALRPRLGEARVEIVTAGAEGAALPWELLRDPDTDTPLATGARAVVRAPTRRARPTPPAEIQGPLRILLVISRPRSDQDVPFRSVAGRLVARLDEDTLDLFRFDLLRPPTFARMDQALREARAEGRPYHVVHFDGHGTYDDLDARDAGQPPRRMRGYLLFENAAFSGNQELIDGEVLGGVLAASGVPLLILNACRSAHVEASAEPAKTGPADSKDRAFGSLAQEVAEAGIPAVVAMRYNVYVDTAARFVADLYAALSRGATPGEAVTRGRSWLAESPQREVGYEPRPLQDWSVPVVYEASPLAPFPVGAAVPKAGARDSLASGWPGRHASGFIGRDEAILALDRAFDQGPVVLLCGLAGSGKTATAAEFALWYARTGGLPGGRVLFTSFQQHRSLAQILDQIGQAFAADPEGERTWPVGAGERRQAALRVLGNVPVLWVWDGVELVASSSLGVAAGWSPAERAELADFLRDAGRTRARLLLTSRRDERAWLGDLHTRVDLPAMPMLERVQLARSQAEGQGQSLEAPEAWRPLLELTQGNPLTITVLVGRALCDRLQGSEQIKAFVARLRAGEADFTELSEGLHGSQVASLRSSFLAAFDERDRERLALLRLFQGHVDATALIFMGHPTADWCLPEVRGLTREAAIELLDRAAEAGLLTAAGGGRYATHPALAWLFGSSPPAAPTQRAFVEAMGEVATVYFRAYEDGHRDVTALAAEEANLLHARRLARHHGLWKRVISVMQGLYQLYDHTGRWQEWEGLVREIEPDFTDQVTGGPIYGREEEWSFVAGYRIRLAFNARDWVEAERVQRAEIAWSRRQAEADLGVPPAELDELQRNAIRGLAVSSESLGQILREQGNPDCVGAYQEAMRLYLRVGETVNAAGVAVNLGHAYKNILPLRDLEAAAQWYVAALELFGDDRLGRARCLGQLGAVAAARFEEAVASGVSLMEAGSLLREALTLYEGSLALLPEDAVGDLAVVHTWLGNVFRRSGHPDRAMAHFRDAITYREQEHNRYDAGGVRFNAALTLAAAGALLDAREYARAALEDFTSLGDIAVAEAQRTQNLLDHIDQDLKSRRR